MAAVIGPGFLPSYPVNKRHWPNSGSLLGQRLRRWTSIEPATSYVIACWLYVLSLPLKTIRRTLDQCLTNFFDIGPALIHHSEMINNNPCSATYHFLWFVLKWKTNVTHWSWKWPRLRFGGNIVTPGPLSHSITFFSHLKLCLAIAKHNFKWLKMYVIREI